jgi:GNAT superfamily N-acetyltransferase
LTDSNLLALYDRTMREHAHPAGLAREASEFTARYTTESGSLRYILWHRFDEALAPSVVSDELHAVRGRAASIMWKVYAHDEPSVALVPRLLTSGFERENEHTNSLMMIAVDDVLARLPAEPPSHLEVRQLVTAQSLDAYQLIWDAVWPESPNERYVNDYRTLAARCDPGVQFFAGFDGTEPVTSGYMFHPTGDPIVLLCGGATKQEWRGRGVYKAMIAARAKAAKVRGARYLSVEASPESKPILSRLGFIELSTLVCYERVVA